MAFIADLAAHDYHPDAPEGVAVGWLDEVEPFSHSDVARGNGEIWPTSTDGTHYVAPTLVVHYIDVHAYLPPSPKRTRVARNSRRRPC